jgi:hypothetical protein
MGSSDKFTLRPRCGRWVPSSRTAQPEFFGVKTAGEHTIYSDDRDPGKLLACLARRYLSFGLSLFRHERLGSLTIFPIKDQWVPDNRGRSGEKPGKWGNN